MNHLAAFLLGAGLMGSCATAIMAPYIFRRESPWQGKCTLILLGSLMMLVLACICTVKLISAIHHYGLRKGICMNYKEMWATWG